MQTRCHLSVLIHEQAKKYGARGALTFRNFGSKSWKTVSWKQFSLRVMQVSNALIHLGVKPQESIGVFAQNCIQYLYADFGAYGVRAITIPFYATCSEQQIKYMIHDAQVRILFVGEQEQFEKARRIFALCPSLERVIIFDRSVQIGEQDSFALYFDDFIALGEDLSHQTEVEERWAAANDEDICNILYTSGTTGDSKGVVLTYGQYHAAMIANYQCVPIRETDRVMDFLPITHIFERGWLYLCLTVGAHIIINTYPKEIQESMREMHPTCMCAVPRFWEKMYIAVKEKIDNSNPLQKKLFNRALAVGKKYNIDNLSHGKRPPRALSIEYEMYNKTVMALVRKQIGLEKAHIFPTAGAYVSPEVEMFTHSIGICMQVGYGLTESLATVSCDHVDKPYTIGSVGRPIEGIEIKIGENSEILLKGPTITSGYYQREHINEVAFDEDGFFHTGDAGYLKDGELYLTERIKDLFKTSNGKYVAPQMIEAMMLVDKYIDQAVIIADQRKFVSALIVPEFRLLEEYAHDHGIAFNSREEICGDARIVKMMLDRILTLQQSLAHYEQVKRITLVPHHFTMERGELTNTLKIKRPAINKNYKDIINKMYEE
ncbi:long-chain fatty acid--CoA ligase [Hoylesella timonensis]|uniref:Long-chain fatty acid--CoA ligase n=1 Tax=Hoylesella timonensis TaxID=386414 RepID=A0A2K0XDN9_9BACT|nr:long-chain fatty acid--CoA ligase [Hoylesella timonensis]PNP92623.1 long-chain fatty acid--CoA ligase [Hoylesella timonensis]